MHSALEDSLCLFIIEKKILHVSSLSDIDLDTLLALIQTDISPFCFVFPRNDRCFHLSPVLIRLHPSFVFHTHFAFVLFFFFILLHLDFVNSYIFLIQKSGDVPFLVIKTKLHILYIRVKPFY